MIAIADDKEIGTVANALADPTRRRIVQLLGEGPRTATDLYGEFAIAGPAVSRHLRVLCEAGVIAEQPVAGDRRVRLYRLEPRPLGELAAWLEGVSAGWQGQLDAFKDYVAVRGGRGTEKR